MFSSQSLISRDNEILSPFLIASFFRTSAFKGSRYESDFLSGKIDVLQLVLPIVTRTGNDPHPLFA